MYNSNFYLICKVFMYDDMKSLAAYNVFFPFCISETVKFPEKNPK